MKSIPELMVGNTQEEYMDSVYNLYMKQGKKDWADGLAKQMLMQESSGL